MTKEEFVAQQITPKLQATVRTQPFLRFLYYGVSIFLIGLGVFVEKNPLPWIGITIAILSAINVGIGLPAKYERSKKREMTLERIKRAVLFRNLPQDRASLFIDDFKVKTDKVLEKLDEYDQSALASTP